MNSGWYIRHTDQLQQPFTDRFMDSDQDRGLFRISANPFQVSYEYDEPI